MVQVSHNNILIDIEAKAVSAVGKYIGLMFKSRETENLIFEFKDYKRFTIHSCFVFFPFLALWIDRNNRVLKSEIVNPWRLRVSAEKNAKKLVEIPLNNENRQIIEFLVGKERFK